MRAAHLVTTFALVAATAAAQTPAVTPTHTKTDMLERAAAELARGNRAEATRLLESASSQFQSARALLQLAKVQSGDGNRRGALDSLAKARAIAPNSEEVLIGFAQVSLAARSLVPAILTLEALTRICPTVGQYHYLLGVALLQVGDMAAAVESLQQAEHLEPDKPLTLVALGLALNNRKLYAEARPYLQRSLEIDPDAVEAMAALAECEEGLGELDLAKDHASRVLAKAKGNATANLVMGLLWMKQAQYQEARDALQQAVAADPGSSKAHYQLSLAYARLGDEAAAQKHVESYRETLRASERQIEELRGRTARPGSERDR